MKHLMVDLATLLVCSCSIYVSLVFLKVCGSSDGVHTSAEGGPPVVEATHVPTLDCFIGPNFYPKGQQSGSSGQSF